MPLFGGDSSPFDELVEKATGDKRTSEDWALIMDICDRIAAAGSKGARDGLTAIRKRLNHRDPHVTMLALSVLDSCWSNCGESFRREVSSREMCQELRHQATASNYTIAEKARSLLKKWAEDECRKDASLSLVASLYSELRQEGLSFEPSHPGPKTTQTTSSTSSASRKEEDDIARAIAESLKESSARPQASSQATITSAPLYPSAASSLPPSTAPVSKDPPRVVKALYDFEAAEENELTFKAGAHISVLDDSDMNWWKGRVGNGPDGLFPVSFVTADLTQALEGETVSGGSSGKKVEFSEEVAVAEVEAPAAINEAELERCLEMLAEADPTGDRADPPELAGLEAACRRQGPLIDAELAALDREANALTSVDMKVREALALYNQAMAEATQQLQASMASASIQPQTAQPATAVPTTNAYAPPQTATAQAPSLDAYAQHSSIAHVPSAYAAQPPPPQQPQAHYIPQYQQ